VIIVILVGLGTNLSFCGCAPADIADIATNAVSQLGSITKKSHLYRSPAWPNTDDPEFINGVLVLKTRMTASDLLKSLHKIEAAFGRRRREANAPRTLDLDLLAYDRLTIGHQKKNEGFIVPHPGIIARDFVLKPIVEVAPTWRHPVTGKTAGEMLDGLSGLTAVRI